jgi:hypothetical protein
MTTPSKSHLTTGEIATRRGVYGWQARRAVDDALGDGVLRAGLYRLVPAELLPRVEAELRRKGYLREEAAASAS